VCKINCWTIPFIFNELTQDQPLNYDKALDVPTHTKARNIYRNLIFIFLKENRKQASFVFITFYCPINKCKSNLTSECLLKKNRQKKIVYGSIITTSESPCRLEVWIIEPKTDQVKWNHRPCGGSSSQ